MKIPDNAKNWERAMRLRGSPEAEQVLKNVEQEANVPDGVATLFFTKLGGSFDSTGDPLQHMETVVGTVKTCALAGPTCTPDSDTLTRFASLHHLADQPDLKRAGVSARTLLQMPRLVGRIKTLGLGNRRGVVWAALFEEIRVEMDNGVSVDEILNRLGLSETLVDPVYQVYYNKADIGKPCQVPTVLDAGSNHRFRCAAKDAKSGRTWPCSGKGDGFSEFVHGVCTARAPTIKIYSKVR
jgi:hypothetical protein